VTERKKRKREDKEMCGSEGRVRASSENEGERKQRRKEKKGGKRDLEGGGRVP
jgi:hypothetical protein